jgi:hypothetical protein
VSVQTGTFMIVGERNAAVVGARAAAIAKSRLGMAARSVAIGRGATDLPASA